MVALVLFIFGSALIAPLATLFYRRRMWEAHGVPTQGTIVGVQKSARKRRYRPVYAYSFHGRDYQSAPGFYTDRDSVRDKAKGSIETILVHREQPLKIRMQNFSYKPLYIATAPFAVIGALLWLAALGSV